MQFRVHRGRPKAFAADPLQAVQDVLAVKVARDVVANRLIALRLVSMCPDRMLVELCQHAGGCYANFFAFVTEQIAQRQDGAGI